MSFIVSELFFYIYLCVNNTHNVASVVIICNLEWSTIPLVRILVHTSFDQNIYPALAASPSSTDK
jgi:hypothetical protein